MLARTPLYCFVEKIYDFAFQGHLKPSKGDEQGSDNRLL